MLTKLLRFPVPDQIKALLEKIDIEGAALDSSSRYEIRELLDESLLTRYERYLLKRGLTKYERAKVLDRAMCIVLNQPDEQDKIPAAQITGAQITGAQITGYPSYNGPRAMYRNTTK